MPFNITFHDFTHGQLDKTLKSRSDLDIYNKGALELKNLVVRPGGAVKSRFGTQFLFETPTDLLEPANDGYQMFAFAPSEQLKLLIILKEFLPGESQDNLSDKTPLISTGVLDSLAVLRLVALLEETYGIKLEAHEVSVDNLDTVSDIADFVRSKSR